MTKYLNNTDIRCSSYLYAYHYDNMLVETKGWRRCKVGGWVHTKIKTLLISVPAVHKAYGMKCVGKFTRELCKIGIRFSNFC